jgi:ketosteroid isomerase-like protein
MRSDAEGIVEAVMQAYALGDYDMAAAFYANDASFAMFTDHELRPFFGECVGRQAIVAAWDEMKTVFDIRRFELRNLITSGDIVRCQVDYDVRHRTTAESIDGRARLVFEVRNGLIVREREYNDVERLRAFMRLCGVAHHTGSITASRP